MIERLYKENVEPSNHIYECEVFETISQILESNAMKTRVIEIQVTILSSNASSCAL